MYVVVEVNSEPDQLWSPLWEERNVKPLANPKYVTHNHVLWIALWEAGANGHHVIRVVERDLLLDQEALLFNLNMEEKLVNQLLKLLPAIPKNAHKTALSNLGAHGPHVTRPAVVVFPSVDELSWYQA